MCKKNNIYFLRYFKSLPLLKDFDYESHSVNWLPFENVLKQLNFDLGLLSARDFLLIFIQQKSLPFLKGFACDILQTTLWINEIWRNIFSFLNNYIFSSVLTL
jgi:hypothetical protein